MICFVGYGWTVQLPSVLRVLSPAEVLIAGPQFEILPGIDVIFQDYPSDEAAIAAGAVAGGAFTEEEIVPPPSPDPPAEAPVALPRAPKRSVAKREDSGDDAVVLPIRRSSRLSGEDQVSADKTVRRSSRISELMNDSESSGNLANRFSSVAHMGESASGAVQSVLPRKRALSADGDNGATGASRSFPMRRLAGPPIGAIAHMIVTRLNQHASGADRIVEPFPIPGTNISLVVSSAPSQQQRTELDSFFDADFLTLSLLAAQDGNIEELNALFDSRFDGLIRRNDARSVRALFTWAEAMLDQGNEALQFVADSEDEDSELVGEGRAGGSGRHWTGGRGRRGVAKRAIESRRKVSTFSFCLLRCPLDSTRVRAWTPAPSTALRRLTRMMCATCSRLVGRGLSPSPTPTPRSHTVLVPFLEPPPLRVTVRCAFYPPPIRSCCRLFWRPTLVVGVAW